MQLKDFEFDLPTELIAQYPVEPRHASRLLLTNRESGALSDKQFVDLPNLLQAGDLLIFNDTRVMPARLYGNKATGGQIEMLVERVCGEYEVLAHIRASKAPKAGAELIFSDDFTAEVLGRDGDLFHCKFNSSSSHNTIFDILHQIGHIPLPPYIERPDEESDIERYQTVYAKQEGAVAAPTAGLHFDEKIFQALAERGIETEYLTLHVGAGTFQPVRVDDITQHHMHAEYCEVPKHIIEAINACKARGNNVIAVGTTVVRSLESAAQAGTLKPFQGETDIFIYPGFDFKVIDGMVTNFHLPGSSLIMLISAFVGLENIMHAYQHAIAERYRFYSYGDAMLLL